MRSRCGGPPRVAERGESIALSWWALLGLASVGATTVMLAFRHARSWHFFADAAQLFTAGSGVEGAGLDLYRVHPEFQFGPIEVVIAVGAPVISPQHRDSDRRHLGGTASAGSSWLPLTQLGVRTARTPPADR